MTTAVTCILAYDPNSAFAIFFPDYDRLLVEDVPIVDGHVDVAILAARWRSLKPTIAITEIAGARPSQGVVSMFKYGQGFGCFLGIIGTIGIPLHMTSASRWKKHFGLTSDKEKSRALALQLCPDRSDLFKRKCDRNRSEAALLARYAAEVIPRGGQ